MPQRSAALAERLSRPLNAEPPVAGIDYPQPAVLIYLRLRPAPQGD